MMAAPNKPLAKHITYEDGLRDGAQKERAAIVRYLKGMLLPERAAMIARGDQHE